LPFAKLHKRLNRSPRESRLVELKAVKTVQESLFNVVTLFGQFYRGNCWHLSQKRCQKILKACQQSFAAGRAPVNHIEAAQVAPRVITGKKSRKYVSFKRNTVMDRVFHSSICVDANYANFFLCTGINKKKRSVRVCTGAYGIEKVNCAKGLKVRRA
jgi:hypothetical protein